LRIRRVREKIRTVATAPRKDRRMHPIHRSLAIALGVALVLTTAGAAAKPAATPAKVAVAAPVEGTDYVLIDTPDPIHGRKVEVVEVFGYGCPVCNRFQAPLAKWEKTLPADVAFSYLPAAFGPDAEHCWDDFARAFFAARALGVPAKSHDGIYNEVFEQHRLAGCESVPSLWSDYGVDTKTFAARMRAFDIDAKVSAARDQAVTHWGVDGTPTIVIDGRYRVALTQAGGPEGMLRTVDWLIAKQRPLHRGH
jgi:thiol:disulfide interchange protein DsbA